MDERGKCMEKKGKIVRYELIPIFAILALAIGFGIFYFQHQAQKMNENGAAIALEVKSDKEWSQNFELFLQTDEDKKIMLQESNVIEDFQVHKIVLFSGTADLIFAADGQDYTLVSNIDGNARQGLNVTITVSELDNKLNFDTVYRLDPLVDFSKFK